MVVSKINKNLFVPLLVQVSQKDVGFFSYNNWKEQNNLLQLSQNLKNVELKFDLDW